MLCIIPFTFMTDMENAMALKQEDGADEQVTYIHLFISIISYKETASKCTETVLLSRFL